MKKIFITGAGGYIGGNLVKFFSKKIRIKIFLKILKYLKV